MTHRNKIDVKNIYLQQDGEQKGPYSRHDLGKILKKMTSHEDCKFWKDGMDDWQPISILLDSSRRGETVIEIDLEETELALQLEITLGGPKKPASTEATKSVTEPWKKQANTAGSSKNDIPRSQQKSMQQFQGGSPVNLKFEDPVAAQYSNEILNKWTFLLLAIALVQALIVTNLDKGVEIVGSSMTKKYMEQSGASPVSVAAGMGDISELQKLLTAGNDVNEVGSDGFTPLQWAVRHSRQKSVKLLFRFGADANFSKNQRDFPLSIAIKNENLEMVRELVEYGADPYTGEPGSTPWDSLEFVESKEILDYLNSTFGRSPAGGN